MPLSTRLKKLSKTRKAEISRDFSAFFDTEVFQNFVDAFPRRAPLGAPFRVPRQIRTGGFEPGCCAPSQQWVRIPLSKIDKLACQAQRAGIFAIGEYPGSATITRWSVFLFLLAFHPSSEIPNATPCRLILASLGFRLRAATVILSGAKPGFAESNCVAAPLGGIRAALSLRMTRNEKRSSSCNIPDFMLY